MTSVSEVKPAAAAVSRITTASIGPRIVFVIVVKPLKRLVLKEIRCESLMRLGAARVFSARHASSNPTVQTGPGVSPKSLGHKEFAGIYRQKDSSRVTAAPTRLSGVDAPEVSPITTGPEEGSQPVVVASALAPTGR